MLTFFFVLGFPDAASYIFWSNYLLCVQLFYELNLYIYPHS